MMIVESSNDDPRRYSPRLASRSTITMPAPGSSILKHPPPVPRPLFRLAKLLLNQDASVNGTVEDNSPYFAPSGDDLPDDGHEHTVLAYIQGRKGVDSRAG